MWMYVNYEYTYLWRPQVEFWSMKQVKTRVH